MKIDKIKKFAHLYLLVSSNGHEWFLCSDKPISEKKLQKMADDANISSNIYLEELSFSVVNSRVRARGKGYLVEGLVAVGSASINYTASGRCYVIFPGGKLCSHGSPVG